MLRVFCVFCRVAVDHLARVSYCGCSHRSLCAFFVLDLLACFFYTLSLHDALPIFFVNVFSHIETNSHITGSFKRLTFSINRPQPTRTRSEERRVGKECRYWRRGNKKKKQRRRVTRQIHRKQNLQSVEDKRHRDRRSTV